MEEGGGGGIKQYRAVSNLVCQFKLYLTASSLKAIE